MPSHTDEQVRSYLLGRLSPELRDPLEAHYFGDDAFWSQVEAVADDLCDDFLSGSLSKSDADLFRQRMNQPDWQRRLAVARAMRAGLATSSQETTHSHIASSNPAGTAFFAWFQSLTAGLRFALAAAAVFAAVGWPLLLFQLQASNRSIEDVRRVLQQEQERARRLEATAESQAAGLRATIEGLQQKLAAQFTLSLTLFPPMRGSHQLVTIPAPTAFVRLQPFIPEPPALGAAYRLVLRTAKGELVWSEEQVPSQSAPDLGVRVPATLLPPGQYELTVQASGPPVVLIASYSIQISAGQASR